MSRHWLHFEKWLWNCCHIRWHLKTTKQSICIFLRYQLHWYCSFCPTESWASFCYSVNHRVCHSKFRKRKHILADSGSLAVSYIMYMIQIAEDLFASEIIQTRYSLLDITLHRVGFPRSCLPVRKAWYLSSHERTLY